MMLAVGYASGNIDCYVLSPEQGGTKFKLYTTIKGHKRPVIDLQTQGIKGSIVSISKENVMVAFDISNE